jgi:hypothetical protein
MCQSKGALPVRELEDHVADHMKDMYAGAYTDSDSRFPPIFSFLLGRLGAFTASQKADTRQKKCILPYLFEDVRINSDRRVKK